MTEQYKNDKKASRSGAFGKILILRKNLIICKGTTTRVQPRFQKGKQTQYDQIVNQRVEQDLKKLQSVKNTSQQKSVQMNNDYEKQIQSMAHNDLQAQATTSMVPHPEKFQNILITSP